MTPAQLLESVKKRFTSLLVDDDVTLKALLTQTLATYQDRAGVISRVRIEKSHGVNLLYPEDYLSLIHVTDGKGTLVYSDPFPDSIDLDLTGDERFPLTMLYFINLRDRNIDEWQIPPSIISALEDYLEALINIPNTERLRRAYVAGKLDTSGLADEMTLMQRKTDLEEKMAANRAIIPIATIA
ncbi:hypothetical protein [Atlantibacter hermannii]|uniref:hypothetical protein n=1 Tax=Atlantibacter hermannii TaxID=565 RepID=UPI0028A12D0A|nr:hypothetical protein [Atlantibacter hermannii]